MGEHTAGAKCLGYGCTGCLFFLPSRVPVQGSSSPTLSRLTMPLRSNYLLIYDRTLGGIDSREPGFQATSFGLEYGLILLFINFLTYIFYLVYCYLYLISI